MDDFRKQPTETEMLEVLRRGGIVLPPIVLRLLELGPRVGDRARLDALVEGTWPGGGRAIFALELKALSTPKALLGAVGALRASPLPPDWLPMVMVPYLSDDRLRELERLGVSGVDLCGNGAVTVPGKLAIVRSGQANRFASSQPIKNIYRRRSSLVGRVFLCRPAFPSVKEIVAQVASRDLLLQAGHGQPVTVATVSKVIAGLEQDLVIARERGLIRLLQPDTLLDKLALNHTRPAAESALALKVELAGSSLPDLLGAACQALGLPIVATGLSSVWRYATMPRGEVLSVYCPQASDLVARLTATVTDRFPNLEIIETQDVTAYFDAPCEQRFRWAAPVQAFLELASGDKRDQEAAEQVRAFLLNQLGQVPR
jgi:hypothetical protein